MAWVKRSLAGMVTLSTLAIALLLTSGATALAATISTNSTEVEPGEVIEVTGSIDPLDLEHSVTFHWDAEDGPRIGKVQFVVLTYETTVTIPETATAGEHQIYACNDTCGSTTVTVVVATTTTTTTTTTSTTTTTTQPDTTTTTHPDTTTTTQPDTTTTTSGDSATTTDPGPAAASPSTTLVAPASTTPGPMTEEEAVSAGGAAPESSPTDDDFVDSGGGVTTTPEQGEASSSDESGTGSQSSTPRYIPPARTTIPPVSSATPSEEHGAGDERAGRDNDDKEEEDSGLEVVAVGDDDGGSFDSPLVPWPVWLIVVLLASVAAANRLRDQLDAEAAYPGPMSGWRTIAGRTRQSLARLGGTLTTSSFIPFITATRGVKPHILPGPHVGDVIRNDDVYALQSKLSPIQGDVLEAMAQAMTSWLDYYFLLGEGTSDKRLAHAAEGLKEGAERLRSVEESIEDLIGGDDDAPLRAYQMAVSGWANAFERISEGARLDHIALAHEGFARMSEASTIAEGVVLQRANLGQHPSLSHQLSVLRDLRPAEYVRTRAAKRAKVPWQRALQAAGSHLDWNALSH